MGLDGGAEWAGRDDGVEDAPALALGEDAGDRLAGRGEEFAQVVGAQVLGASPMSVR